MFNNNYDIQGNELSRVIRTYVRSRIIPLGYFGSGPGVRCIVVLGILHYFSRPVFWLLVRREEQVRGLYRKIKKIAGK